MFSCFSRLYVMYLHYLYKSTITTSLYNRHPVSPQTESPWQHETCQSHCSDCWLSGDLSGLREPSGGSWHHTGWGGVWQPSCSCQDSRQESWHCCWWLEGGDQWGAAESRQGLPWEHFIVRIASNQLTLGSWPSISNMVGMFLTEWHMMKMNTISREMRASRRSLLRKLDSVVLLICLK